MRNVALVLALVVVAVLGYVGYRYWTIQSLAKKYATAREIAAASIEKQGSTWTIHIESVIADPIDAVWKALRQPERSAELVPASFHRSALVHEDGNKKSLELEVTLLSLPSQRMLATMTFEDATHRVEIETSKGLQDIHGRYELSALAPDRTLLVFAGTAEEKVSLPVPQSVVEGALRELFVVQVKAIQAAIHGQGESTATTARASTNTEGPKFCAGPPGPDASKQITITVARAGEPAPAGAAEFRNDTPQGYERGYVVDGIAVRESFRLDTTCTTAVAVSGKLLVQVQSVLLRPENLEPWVRRLDLKAMGSVEPPNDTTSTPPQVMKLLPAAAPGWTVVPPNAAPNLASPFAYQVYEQNLF